MARLLFAAALATGCYAPAANTGAPCGPGDTCPEGQECRSGVCFAIGAPHDATIEVVLDDAPVDMLTPPPDAPIDGAPAYVPWGTPVENLSLESAGDGETDPSMTADRLTVVFTAKLNPGDDDLWIATRATTADPFTITYLTALNAEGPDDKSPEISADGKTLFFVSDRSGNFDVYSSTFTTSWSAPVLRSDLSTSDSDSDLGISPDGLTAVVLDETGPDELVFHTRASTAMPFGPGVVKAELTATLIDVGAPTITNDGAVIYFHAGSTRALYRAAKQTNGTYSVPVPVSELNTTGVRTAAPFVLQGDNYMIFERDADLYETSR